MLTQWSKLPENALLDEGAEDTPFVQDWIDDYIQKVFDGVITKDALDQRYYELTGNYLMKGAKRGFRGGPGEFTPFSDEEITIKSIERNIFQFSAAKQYQQVQVMSDFIYENGLKASFSEFKTLANNVFKVYNKGYLKTEFVTAVGQAQSARDWLYFEQHEEQFPWLTYHTQEDNRVRDAHVPLDGYTARVSDPCWRTIAPKNGFRCRCFLTAHEEGRKSRRPLPEFGTKDFPAVFEMNPGTDKLIFDPKTHPYFFVDKGDAELKRNNFNLPLP